MDVSLIVVIAILVAVVLCAMVLYGMRRRRAGTVLGVHSPSNSQARGRDR